MFYSAHTGGFYDEAWHGSRIIEHVTTDPDTGETLDRWTEYNPHCVIPDDAVEITPEQHTALIEGQSTGQRIVADANGHPMLQDPVPLTLAELHAQTLGRVREERQPIISVLDGLQASALAMGEGATALTIETVKQGLRDITRTDLSACTTAEEMRTAIMAAYAKLVTTNPTVATAFKGVIS